jgi:hypothetical protein
MALLALSLSRPPLASAQTTGPIDPATLTPRHANFAWDGDVLRATYSFSDVLTAAVKQKLSNGPSSTIAMRAYVFRVGDRRPVGGAAQTCVVSYDLWNEVYQVSFTNSAGTTQRPVANLGGVERTCAHAQDLAVTTRTSLTPGASYYLAVAADVNPVSEEVRAQLRQWMQRPVGAVEAGPGDALFSAFVLLLFRDVGGSDSTVAFRTIETFVP